MDAGSLGAASGGARALMLQDQVGTLEVGKKADVILVAHTALHMRPTHDLLRTLAMCATPQDVKDVIVDGVVLMRNRLLMQVDEEAIICRASEHVVAVAQRAGF